MAIVTTNDEHYKTIAGAIKKVVDISEYGLDGLKPSEMATLVPRVYKQGVKEGKTEGYQTGYEAGMEEGHAGGVQDEQDRFWDAFQRNGTLTGYSYAFAGIGWIDETYNPKYPINATTAANYMFCYTGITDTKVPIDLGTNRTNKVGVFENASKLVTIPELILGSEIRLSNTAFTNCTKLANITITGTIGYTASFEWCPLTKASIISIVNALSATATGYTVTFKKSAKEAAFTDEEWNALIATKSNWTFSLV